MDLGDLVVAEAEYGAQNLVGVLAEQRRAGDVARAIRQLDRVADREVLAAGRVIDLDHGAGRAQRLVFGDLLQCWAQASIPVIVVQI